METDYGTRRPWCLPFRRDGLVYVERVGLFVFLGFGLATGFAAEPLPTVRILAFSTNRTVEVSRSQAASWIPVELISSNRRELKPGDRIRTRESGWVKLLWYDRSPVALGPRTDALIEPPPSTQKRGVLQLFMGVLYFFHRDKPTDVDVRTRTAHLAVRGTEFAVEVDPGGRTVVSVLDGQVEITNDVGSLLIENGEQGIVEPDQGPRKLPLLEAINVIQWLLYYPGILDFEDLYLSPESAAALAASLSAYRLGDLSGAFYFYPQGRGPGSDPERIYRAALHLAHSEVSEAEALLRELDGDRPERPRRLAEALRRTIAAVKRTPFQGEFELPVSATEWMSKSYQAQAMGDLVAARSAAREAVKRSVDFGFGWARLAEMEFSFGDRAAAGAALEQALRLAPRHAQAFALRGFLLAAENKTREAVDAFEEAMALAPGLGNAWLGRGLCRIRLGQTKAGLEDLLVAASLEPQRAELRSYLAKSFDLDGQPAEATKELALARKLDENDPTPWLYSALMEQRRNRINEAVRDLEQSQARNDNRRVYRSRLLLDQDRAVRGANLANIYLDAGMLEVSAREASRAVAVDYGNYSAHLFLANSFNQLRDPSQVELRYESAWLSEYLIANLLAPVGAGTLSQTVSQQEYSRLFERNRFGFVSSTEYLSRGDWIQNAAQYGRYNDFEYALEAAYSSLQGQRSNNDFEQLTLSLQLKFQLSPSDILFLQTAYYDAEGGDLTRLYYRTNADPNLRFEERQEPLLIAGYHHAWGPGMHTLLLGGVVRDRFEVTTPQQRVLLLNSLPFPPFFPPVAPVEVNLDQENETDIYTIEGQQIWQQPGHSIVAGARYQRGEFRSESRQNNPSGFAPFFPPGGFSESAHDQLDRASVYGYYNWQPLEPLILTAGVAYDWLRYPENFLNAPVTGGEERTDQWSPKAGITWMPDQRTTVRASYTRSLGGVSFDQSFRLEPTQIAGFNQTFRSLIPESLQGTVPGAEHETWGVGVDRKFQHGFYAGVEGTILKSEGGRTLGVYQASTGAPGSTFAADLRQNLDFEERTVAVNLHQLLGENWTLGGRYRLSEAELDQAFPGLAAGTGLDGTTRSVLNQANLFALYHHQSGFYGRLESIWTHQSNHGYVPAQPGDDFWQFNGVLGYRFLQRRVDLQMALLNMTDQDYRLSPLNLTPELPRERTLAFRLRFNF